MTETVTTKPQPIPPTPLAVQNHERLKAMHATARAELAAAERTAGLDFGAVAVAGVLADADVARLGALRASVDLLKSMEAQAAAAVTRAQERDIARAVLEVRGQVQVLLNERNETAARVETLVGELAVLIAGMDRNGWDIVKAYRRLGRPDSVETTAGWVAGGATDLANRDQVLHCLQLELARQIPGWRYERCPPMGRPSFGDAARAAAAGLAMELDPLLGITELDPELIDVIRAEDQAATAVQAFRLPRPAQTKE